MGGNARGERDEKYHNSVLNFVAVIKFMSCRAVSGQILNQGTPTLSCACTAVGALGVIGAAMNFLPQTCTFMIFMRVKILWLW